MMHERFSMQLAATLAAWGLLIGILVELSLRIHACRSILLAVRLTGVLHVGDNATEGGYNVIRMHDVAYSWLQC